MSKLAIIVSFFLLLVSARGAGAQSLGLGGRFSFVDAQVHVDHTERISGVMLRFRTSTKTALELSYDFLGDDLPDENKNSPFQGSLLLYLSRGRLAPYLLGGIGWYAETPGTIQDGEVTTPPTSRKAGYHAGLGAEIGLGPHAAIHADYRYTRIGHSDDDPDTESGAIPIPGLGWLQDKIGLSHKGSTWTTGLTVYF